MRDTDDIGSNHSGNPHIDDVIPGRLGRRGFVGGTLAVAVTGLLGDPAARAVDSDADPGRDGAGHASAARETRRLAFREVPVSTADTLVVPAGYTWDVLAPWGAPLLAGATAFAGDASDTAAEQALQVGFNHDGMHYFPLHPLGNSRGLLVMNHEYTDANQIYTEAQGTTITPDAAGREKVAKALAAHGVSVIAIRKTADGSWAIERGDPRNRRITGTTPMAFSGPVGPDHPLLRSSVTPRPIGTLNNCAHGVTPWNTYLTCEENWNGYFGTDDPHWTGSRTPLEARYGVRATGFGYHWHRAEPRFDLSVNRNELNRFGWVVEIDPFDPGSTPVKRTALGRIKREGATCTERNGRVVVYSGDDQNGDYVYKFVGDAPWRQVRAGGRSPLDHGTLHVARFNEDGSGEWLPIVHGAGPLTPANGWTDQADVLIRTRMAADALGATRLHRPEWISVHPTTQEVYLTLTNGSGNDSAANGARDPNPFGHILRWVEARDSDTTFRWDVFLLGGDPAFDPRVPADQPVFGSPDGIRVDADGIVWIQTDISNRAQNRGVHAGVGNNQMLAAGSAHRRDQALPDRTAGLRDNGRHHHPRPADDVHQRPASGRIDRVLE